MNELLRQPGASKHSVPRLSPRYRMSAEAAELRMPVRRRIAGTRTMRLKAELVDLSVGGALLSIPSEASVVVGNRAALTLADEQIDVGIRHAQEGDRLRVGVAFRSMTPSFNAWLLTTLDSMVDDPRRRNAWRVRN